jgi:ABC-2 type transport system permease protein
MSATYSPTRSLRRFGFRQTLRGSIILGLLCGLMMGAQGAAYAAAYPDQHSRDTFVKSLESVPAIGFMAGEIRDASSPASYSIYKSIALTTLIVAVWGLLTTTRLLRGQEEDGYLEQILAGRTTKKTATIHILIGYSYSLALAFVITWLAIAGLGLDPKVNLSVGNAGLLALGVFLPATFFATLGILVSQLALTRGRAMAYGLGILLFFFTLRGAGNSIAEWNDLKRFTPFGWTDLLNPVLSPDTIWILPTIIFAVVAIPLSLYFAARRDLGESILPQSESVRSHFYLLSSDLGYSIRQNIWPFVWWAIGTIAYAGLLASIAKVGADALSSSPAFTKVIGSLGSNYNDLVIAFLGFGGMFTALILLVMSAVAIGSIRNQEAKLYLDNILVQPVHKTAWLAKRLIIILMMVIIIAISTGVVIWQIASAQGVHLELGLVLQNSVTLVGAVIVLIGLGGLLYGVLPRFATMLMYIAIVWAFLADVLKALFSLNDAIDKTSLLHYVTFAPTKAPDWSTFAWLVAIGVIASLVGIFAFAKRDIIPE